MLKFNELCMGILCMSIHDHFVSSTALVCRTYTSAFSAQICHLVKTYDGIPCQKKI